MPRPKRRGPDTGPVAVLETMEAEAAAAAAGGDPQMINLHRQVRSWLGLARDARGDRETGELFVIFAAEGRHRLDQWWANTTRT